MRIGIDARMVEHSGIGTYIRQLVRAYRTVDEVNEYVLLGNPGKLKQFTNGERFSVRQVDAGIYGPREQLELPIRVGDVQLLHSPHYNTPLMANVPVVVTVHDLIHLIFPEHLGSSLQRFYSRFLLRKACQKARKIITGSRNSQEDIVERLGVKPEKIQVIPYGVASHFRPIEDEEVKERYIRARRLPARYILYVGNNKLHKNLAALVRAFRDLGGGVRDLYRLVLTGERNPQDEALSRAIAELGEEKIFFLGYVPEEEMPLLYNCASLFVFPSRYEGFGLPPLEAMERT